MAHGTASRLALRTTSRDAEVGSSVDRRTVVIDDLARRSVSSQSRVRDTAESHRELLDALALNGVGAGLHYQVVGQGAGREVPGELPQTRQDPGFAP